MTKKKEPVPIVAPITSQEFFTMVEIWQKIKPILEDLGRAVTTKDTTDSNRYYSWPSYESHWPDVYGEMDEKGIYFYHLEPEEYDTGHRIVTELIPFDALMNPEIYIAAAQETIADVEKRRAAQQRENEKAQYETLKKKFEK